jgi:hypothetical protein
MERYYKVVGDSGLLIALIKETRDSFMVMSNGKDWHENDDYAFSHINGYDSEDNSYDIAERIKRQEARSIIAHFKSTLI